jgi:hypothetical protein
MNLTRREKHLLIIAVITLAAVFALRLDQETLNNYEYLWLIFYVAPLGIYALTDPERR